MKKKKSVTWSIRSHPRLKADLIKRAKKNKMTLNEYICVKLSMIAYDGGIPKC